MHIFKRKGGRSVCDDQISLLSIPGKILARVILNRLMKHVGDNNILPEGQCRFRAGRSMMDMIFTAWELQEECHERKREPYAVFVDLTKAFDSTLTGLLSGRSCLKSAVLMTLSRLFAPFMMV